jgi:hypothetical protein
MPRSRASLIAVVRSGLWRSAAIVVLTLIVFGWTYYVGRSLGMAASLPRDSFTRAEMSIAVAISRLSYGASGYVLYTPVVHALIEGGFNADSISVSGRIDAAIERARALHFRPDCAVPQRCLDDWGDDKGYADFVILAFWLFGFGIGALYNFYFLLLAVSLLMFTAQFFTDPERLLVMLFFVSAHYATMLILPNSTVTSVVHDARFLPAASTLAALHIALVLLRLSPLRTSDVAIVAGQVLIIVLAIDGRSSTKWQIVFIATISVIAVLRAACSSPWRAHILVDAAVVVGLGLAGVAGLDVYKRMAYDERYLREGIPSHVVWHNVYMGFGIHPSAVARFDLNPTDATSYRHADRFLRSHPETATALGIDMTRVAYPLFTAVGWRKYDEVVRAMYFRFWRDHPGYAFQTYALYKPKYLLEQIRWQLRPHSRFPAWVAVDEAVLPARRVPFNPFNVLAATAVGAGVVLAGLRAPRVSYDCALLGAVLVACSLIPSVVVAPLYYELPAVFLAIAVLIYAIGAALLVIIAKRWLLRLG